MVKIYAMLGSVGLVKLRWIRHNYVK